MANVKILENSEILIQNYLLNDKSYVENKLKSESFVIRLTCFKTWVFSTLQYLTFNPEEVELLGELDQELQGDDRDGVLASRISFSV